MTNTIQKDTYYRSERDRDGECSDRGKIAEDAFTVAAESRGYTVTPIIGRANAKYHSDFIIDHQKQKGLPTMYEVKAMKRLHRRDDEFMTDYHWVEIKNVIGNPGWLYGDAKYFAFEFRVALIGGFMIVPAQLLRDLVVSKIKHPLVKSMDACPDNPSRAVYRRFSREGRADELTLVKNNDLLRICEHIWTETR